MTQCSVYFVLEKLKLLSKINDVRKDINAFTLGRGLQKYAGMKYFKLLFMHVLWSSLSQTERKKWYLMVPLGAHVVRYFKVL